MVVNFGTDNRILASVRVPVSYLIRFIGIASWPLDSERFSEVLQVFGLYPGFNLKISNEMTSLLTVCVFLQMVVNIDGSIAGIRERIPLLRHTSSARARFDILTTEEEDYGKIYHEYPGKIFLLKFGDRNYVFDMVKKSLQTFFGIKYSALARFKDCLVLIPGNFEFLKIL